MAFAAGQFLTATLLNNTFPASDEDTQNTLGTTAATTFTATLTGGTACGVAFTAPLSGVVLVCNNAFVENSTTGRSYCTFRLRVGSTIGSGVDIVAAADENSISIAGSAGDDLASGRTFRVSGLTPGGAYNVQQLFRVSGGTGTFAWKRLAVFPVPA